MKFLYVMSGPVIGLLVGWSIVILRSDPVFGFTGLLEHQGQSVMWFVYAGVLVSVLLSHHFDRMKQRDKSASEDVRAT